MTANNQYHTTQQTRMPAFGPSDTNSLANQTFKCLKYTFSRRVGRSENTDPPQIDTHKTRCHFVSSKCPDKIFKTELSPLFLPPPEFQTLSR
jgi:hypothetical protein